MKNRFLLIAVVCALSAGVRCVGQNPLEIDVQGPWVVYEDDHWFNVSGKSTPVLVLMAPDVMHSAIDEYNHQLPSFTGGDGTWLNPGIHCVHFVDADVSQGCAPARYNAAASGRDNMLHIKAPANWAWYDPTNPENAGRTYLILPLPDDYINDGVWLMKTGATHDPHGAGYTEHLVSIGVYLHYSSISGKRLQLLGCAAPTAPASAFDGNDCKTPEYSLVNRGSIRIDMKGPINNDACDFHVRYAYPRMLKMTDYSALYPAGSTNLNKYVAWVDPAEAFSESGGAYDGDNGTPLLCDTDDPQNRYAQLEALTPPSGARASHGAVPHMSKRTARHAARQIIASKSALLDDINTILNDISKVHPSGNACDRNQPDPYLGCSFRDLRDRLKSRVGAPTYSDVELLNTLLKYSVAANKVSGGKLKTQQSTALTTLMNFESSLTDSFPTKNGNDCRAAIMLATAN